MAGHSHWANIAYKKAIVDAKRGKLWTKLSKAITVAAKMGGGDMDVNVRLRTAVLDARAVSMPKDNIDRAIKRGLGELDGGNIEEALYEGYGPGGVAILCEIATDNRNRTAPEIRKLFEKFGGKLGQTGCVSYLFERKGVFVVATDKVEEDKLLELALEAGADDVKHDGPKFEITCPPDAYTAVLTALEAAGIEPEVKRVTRVPTNTVDVDATVARDLLALVEQLDDHDDVQSVSANFNIPDEAMAQLQE